MHDDEVAMIGLSSLETDLLQTGFDAPFLYAASV
jgi:hypothetical protein